MNDYAEIVLSILLRAENNDQKIKIIFFKLKNLYESVRLPENLQRMIYD